MYERTISASMAVEATTRRFYVCLYTQGSIINPLSLALDKSDTQTTPDEGGIEMTKTTLDMNTEMDVWIKGIAKCVEVKEKFDNNPKEDAVVHFKIQDDDYKISYNNGWYQLTKNNGGYKSEFYTLGIQDHHAVADDLVQYVFGEE